MSDYFLADLGDSDDSQLECHNISSTWYALSLKYKNDTQIQTLPTNTREVGCQVKDRTHMNIQTDAATNNNLSSQTTAPLPPTFLTACQLMSTELSLNQLSLSNSFYELYERQRDRQEELDSHTHPAAQASAIHISHHAYAYGLSSVSNSINCMNSLLAVAYGNVDHIGWCKCRDVYLNIFSIAKLAAAAAATAAAAAANGGSINVFNASSFLATKPDVSIESSACYSFVQFHPTLPNILACGFFNGEIKVYDLALYSNEEDTPPQSQPQQRGAEEKSNPAAAAAAASQTSKADPLILSSEADDFTHREPISKLLWVKRQFTQKELMSNPSQKDSYHLVSISTDGKVLIWNPFDNSNKLNHPVAGFILDSSSSSSSAASSSSSTRTLNQTILGGLSISFSSDLQTFVVATEAGKLYRGLFSLNGVQQASSASAAMAQMSDKSVLKVGESKFTKEAYRFLEHAPNKFELKKQVENYVKFLGNSVGAANSYNGVIELRHIFAARTSIHFMYASCCKFGFHPHVGPIYDVHFSPFHKYLFLSASTDGSVALRHSLRPKPLHVFECGSSLFSVAFSPIRPLVFAVGNIRGEILIFDLLQSTIKPSLVILTNPHALHTTTSSSSTTSKSRAVSSSNTTADGNQPLVGGILCLNFSSDGSFISWSSSNGDSGIYELSVRYTSLKPKEKEAIKQMGALSTEDEA